ncbi:MAG: EvpB family type VI secretion protein [Gammaproteobacteria bacterium RIFCSPHIGHO2_12_FULL_45_9]|nr:MAG: EvpB family type VI secretion protein [Gammaproteobacteria bacterium RIFCSPHIGHO2_12_FULL_45_9]
MSDAQQQSSGQTATESGTLLDQILSTGKMVRQVEQRSLAEQMVGEFARQILDEEMKVSVNTVSMIESQIKHIDELLTAQINEIIHHEDFKTLESTWRGLNYLVMNTETSTTLKIRVLNASKKDISDDLKKAVEFDQSALFKQIYEEEYGTFGGTPYGLLVGDYYFGKHPQDIALLELVSNVAAAAHAPFMTGTSPELLNLDSFTDLPRPRDLAKIFEGSDYIKWRSFRDTPDSRYVGLCMPHVLMRLPYGPDTLPVDEFNFVEDVSGKDHSRYLWGNAAFAFAERVTRSFALYKWCAAVRGVEGGGLVENLPVHVFKTDEGDLVAKCPTEIAITDRREKELNDLGLIALCYQKNTDKSAFFGAASTNKPKIYDQDAATANAYLSAQLPYIFSASRFAHYLKVIVRDKIGSFTTKSSLEQELNRWINLYVIKDPNADQRDKSMYPLQDARIDVVENPAKPGAYRAIAYVKPHFQLDEVHTSIRLVADLPG